LRKKQVDDLRDLGHYWLFSKDIDYFAVYCEYTEKIYLVPVEDINSTDGVLRIEPTANNQTKGIRWAKDYEI